jgi:hypothetical protein
MDRKTGYILILSLVLLVCNFLFFSIPGCVGHQPKKQMTIKADSSVTTVKLKVKLIDSASFRRSYWAPDNQTAREAYIQEHADPFPMDSISKEVEERLMKAGIIRQHCLVLSKFKYFFDVVDTSLRHELILSSVSGKKIHVSGYYLPDYSEFRLKFHDETDSTVVRLEQYLQEIKIAHADIVPGGYKELIILRNMYIVNGDNYYISIYEVSEKE